MNASTEITVPPANDLPNAPLGIRHLLLLTACTAVAFSVFDWLVDTSTQTPVMRAAGFAYCLIYGGALAGLCIFMTRSWLGIDTLRHPGHLLLVCCRFFFAVVGDYRLEIRRDRLHWCGLAAAGLLAALEWARYVRIYITNFL